MIPRVLPVKGPEDLAVGLMQALAAQGLAAGLLRSNGEGVALSLPAGDHGAAQVLAGLRNLELVISLLPPAEGQEAVELKPGGQAELAQELAARQAQRGQARRLTILADGKPVPTKTFVRDILANTLQGLLGPLHGMEGVGRLEIIIE